MGTTLQEKLASLPPERRARIKAETVQLQAVYMTLKDLRRAKDMTQAHLAKQLGKSQVTIAQMEKRTDLLLSTLRHYVEAIGGRLDLVAQFPDQAPVILEGLGSETARVLSKGTTMNDFAGKFLSIDFYQRYRQLRPFVGSHFQNTRPKILLVAESHYLPKSSTIHHDPDQWYKGNASSLTDEEKSWINTAAIVGSGPERWNNRGHRIYRNLNKILKECLIPSDGNLFEFVSFMNAFQRPAKQGATLQVSELDIYHSKEIIKHVIDTLEPHGVIFVSRKAHKMVGRKIEKLVGLPVYVTSHPSSPYWTNRKDKTGMTGREQFLIAVRKIKQAAGLPSA